MTKTTIRQAKPSDWPFIESWRAGHFLEMAARMKYPRPVTGQKKLGEAIWVVMEREGVPTAAASFETDEDARITFFYDLYAASGHVLDALALGKMLEEMCDKNRLEMRISTDPENHKYIRLMEKRGYVPVSLELKRQPRGVDDGRK